MVPDQDRLREMLERAEWIERPSAPDGPAEEMGIRLYPRPAEAAIRRLGERWLSA